MSNNVFEDLGDRVKINVKYLNPNTILNCPTFDKDGNEVQGAYKPFTKEYLQKLLLANIDTIFYSKHKNTDNVIYQKNLKDYLKRNIYQGPRTLSVETQEKAVNVMEAITNRLSKNEVVSFTDAKDLMDQIETDLYSSKTEIINLLDIQSYDSETYSHSLNTGVVAMLFARKLGFPGDVVLDIGLGGFLHDIGKIRIPYNILHKKDKLTPKEFNLVKNHARYGYEMLKESKEISDIVKRIVLLHHEKFDGTGYPFGFSGSKIEDYVYIVSIAEIYDALTTRTPYREAISHNEAIKTILRGSRYSFKPEIAHQFAHSLGGMLFKESSYYKIGQLVVLNTGEVARVVNKDSDITSRPSIEILKNSAGKDLSKPIFINLNLDDTRNIVSIDATTKIQE